MAEGNGRRARVAVLASGAGTNFEAIAEAAQSGEIAAEVVLLITSREGLPVTERARRFHVDVEVLDERVIGERECDKRMRAVLEVHGVDLVVLAGYLRKVGPQTLGAFHGRIINTHPGPLPQFGGKGMWGDHVHQAVLDSGALISAATVHLVEGEYDSGAVIAARPVPVRGDDSLEQLRDRVREVERKLLVQTVGELAGAQRSC